MEKKKKYSNLVKIGKEIVKKWAYTNQKGLYLCRKHI
jgi:hypothetical protein